ncbi:hypothetical protein PR048_006663 [Dryococelus australis]|uniref:Phorbol-ester/DAG-type domain-containing protein n=1 Tax=Dryococelus australis TaxID=614101 RepID=A0ABQ9IDT1_9NEOP|nr:hypothetical protein PR048_006663 [Dryococelus australis]
MAAADQQPASHGHTFTKKTFHKPTYCHHCTDMLWGLIQQGYICEGRSPWARSLRLGDDRRGGGGRVDICPGMASCLPDILLTLG